MKLKLIFSFITVSSIFFSILSKPAIAACQPGESSAWIVDWEDCKTKYGQSCYESGAKSQCGTQAYMLTCKECCCAATVTLPPGTWTTPPPGATNPLPIYCLVPGTNKTGVDTALGCISTDFNDFVVWFLQRAIGISGGIAFLLMIFGGFKILTSAGDPKGVQAGGEMITSAITGLLFIIFSVFLLELIGVKILGIPGL